MRLNVELSDKDAKQLDSLMELSGVDTKAKLIDYALVFLAWGLNASYRGQLIASVDEEKDRYRELQMPPLHYAAMLGEADRMHKKDSREIKPSGGMPKKRRAIPEAAE